MSGEGKCKRTLTGRVVSNKMDKTITVEVVRYVSHKVYKKYISVRRKFYAHDEQNICGMGDVVRIAEHRPISKNKNWMLVEVIEKAS
jgi:small subunit ribosomal protein S17